MPRIIGSNHLHHPDLIVGDPERSEDLLRGIGFPVHHDMPVVGHEAAVMTDRIFPAGGHAERDGLQVSGCRFDQCDQLVREFPDIRVLARCQDARGGRAGVGMRGRDGDVACRDARPGLSTPAHGARRLCVEDAHIDRDQDVRLLRVGAIAQHESPGEEAVVNAGRRVGAEHAVHPDAALRCNVGFACSCQHGFTSLSGRCAQELASARACNRLNAALGCIARRAVGRTIDLKPVSPPLAMTLRLRSCTTLPGYRRDRPAVPRQRQRSAPRWRPRL